MAKKSKMMSDAQAEITARSGKKKPKTKKVTKVTKEGEGRASVNERKLKVDGEKAADLREGSVSRQVADVFKGGKTVAAAVSDLELNFNPPRSKSYAANPRKFILGYVSHLVSKGILTEA